MFANQVLKFNSTIKNTNLTKIFNTFRIQTDFFGYLDVGDTIPDQSAILMSDKINTQLLSKYLAHNIKQNVIGYLQKPNFAKLSNIDTKYIMLSVILFNQLQKESIDNIIEIGAGFGNMLRINYSIQNFKTWNIIDYLHMNLLQEFYLSSQHVPKNKYTLTPSNTNIGFRNEKNDLVISIYSLSEYSMKDFLAYYENIIKNTKYFFYVFNKIIPSAQLNNAKNSIISKDFELLKNFDSNDNLICICLYVNKNFLVDEIKSNV